jgi:hypothetical protein
LAEQDFTKQIRQLAHKGLSARELGDLTPYQLFRLFFDEPREEPAGDALEALHRINRKRETAGERPAIPHWWGGHLPRKPRPQPRKPR